MTPYLSSPRRSALRLKTLGISCFIVALGALSFSAPPLADSVPPMQSASYIMDPSQFIITSGEKSSASYTLTDSVGQIGAGQFDSTGYTVFAGFQYLYALSEFSFSIDDVTMDFGTVQPFVFSNDSNVLTVTTSTNGYSVLALAENPLENNSSNEIPFTTCDTPCTITTAAAWIDPDNVGFGFNANGVHASSDFVNSTYFRPYADESQSQSAQTIASHNAPIDDDTITVTYKLSVSESQEAGEYTTTIKYTAVPSF